MSHQETSFTVYGFPSTFGTSKEDAWKLAIEEQAPRPTLGGEEIGIVARFRVNSLAPRGVPLDIDNLCEPLFSVLIDRLRWFNGSRTNVAWLQATKEISSNPGCEVTITSRPPPQPPMNGLRYSGCYSGPLPTSTQTAEVAAWAAKLNRLDKLSESDSAVSCFIGFGDPGINIGDVASGAVKSFIDSLYPVLGGQVGTPADHWID